MPEIFLPSVVVAAAGMADGGGPRRDVALPIGWFFTFVIPVIVVANVPAGVMVRKLLNPSSAEFDPLIIGYTALATLLLLGLSRWFFHFALKRYRSASS
jgi:ABC-type uncharacterized transport system permease subunit